mmetsp:Transcript_42703/g.91000  ORF Transcript_42703/g.91000 Transcript_42703/m.91000 type:complete len:84 (+) Transcript_42703:1548-1799(+)
MTAKIICESSRPNVAQKIASMRRTIVRVSQWDEAPPLAGARSAARLAAELAAIDAGCGCQEVRFDIEVRRVAACGGSSCAGAR